MAFQYMPILPIGLLNAIDSTNVSSVFILPQYWGINDYASFYTSRKWDTVIIDNALYEQTDGYGLDGLLAIAGDISSSRTYVVGPESIGNGIETSKALEAAIDQYGSRGSKWNLMGVFQGSPWEMRSMKDQFENKIAYSLPISVTRQGYSRRALHKFIFGSHPSTYVHALGLDTLVELVDLQGVFDSTDSSLPASAMVNNISLYHNLGIMRTQANQLPRVDLSTISYSRESLERTISNITLIQSFTSSL